MRHAFCLALLFGVVSAADAPVIDPALAPLIAKLGDDDFDTRETAEKAIIARAREHEEAFTPMLSSLLAGERDPEIRGRIEKLIAKISVVGSLDWSVEAGQIYQLPAISNNRIYIGNKDGTLLCYDITKGTKLWTHENGGPIYKSLAVEDGRVIAIRVRKEGRPDGRVFAFDALDGHELWSWQDDIKSQNFTAPIIANGSVFLGRASELICLDALQGEKRWSIKTENALSAPPSVSDGRMVIEQFGGALQCISANDGKILWALQLESHSQAGACMNGERCFVAGGVAVYCVDVTTGVKKWESSGLENVGVPLAVKGNRVLAAHSQTLRCLSAEDGREMWSRELGGHIYAQPALVGNRVYVGALNTKLTMYCLDAATGETLWTHVTTEGGYAEPIIVGRRLFVGYHSKFYCLKTGMPGPASWPMSGGNPGRSGCNDH
ncbi:MAG: PQQ-binding-like beta-propeller repeat protein [Planctomycetota bacterium]